MDDGAEMITRLHTRHPEKAGSVLGGTDETTTGVLRLRSLEREGMLLFPIIAVNDARTKQFFDNRYGTGQSTIDGIIRATNMLVAGKHFVVAGYGWCGKGIASRARGMGAKVIICEVDPLKALEAVMDGFDVMTLRDAVKIGDVIVTATGGVNILRKEHFRLLKDGAMLANAGRFKVEIDLETLESMAEEKAQLREFVDEYRMPDGKTLYLLGEGRTINLTAAEGHPAQVMDVSFANQVLAVEFLVTLGKKLDKKVYKVPQVLDREIARLKLRSMGIGLDTLTKEQKQYLTTWGIEGDQSIG
jgi:adenosylhomocysteinase